MPKTPDNFIQKIKKLENYLLLREEKDYLLVATHLTISIHKERKGVFQTYSDDIDTPTYILFVIRLTEDMTKLNAFTEGAMIYMDTDRQAHSVEELQKVLDDFINKTFF